MKNLKFAVFSMRLELTAWSAGHQKIRANTAKPIVESTAPVSFFRLNRLLGEPRNLPCFRFAEHKTSDTMKVFPTDA
jgi:hypothetical protein